MAAHLFISYSRADGAFVDQLVQSLTTNGIGVWIDHSLAPGTPAWTQAVEQAIEASAAVIVVMSEASRKSTWVDREIDLAQELRKPVVPLLVSGRPVFRLRDLQHVDMRHGPQLSPTVLLALHQLVGAGAPQPPVAPAPAPLAQAPPFPPPGLASPPGPMPQPPIPQPPAPYPPQYRPPVGGWPGAPVSGPIPTFTPLPPRKKGLSAGAVVGIVLAAVLVVGGGCAALVFSSALTTDTTLDVGDCIDVLPLTADAVAVNPTIVNCGDGAAQAQVVAIYAGRGLGDAFALCTQVTVVASLEIDGNLYCLAAA